MSDSKHKTEDERACDRILIELGRRDAALASSLTELISKPKFTQMSKFEKKLTKLKLLRDRQPDLLREIVAELRKIDGPSGKSGTTSPFIKFLEGMPNLRGSESGEYTEYSGGNYRNK